jgi:hypothetical protein
VSAIAYPAIAVPEGRLAAWARRAWRRMGWRQVLLGLGLHVFFLVFGPLGGVFFLPFDASAMGADAVVTFLNGTWLTRVWLIYGVMVADEAFDDGVPPLRAYGLGLVVLATLTPVAGWFLADLTGWYRMQAPQMLFGVVAYLFQGGLAISIYAYWRVTQRSMRQAQAAETERVRNEQRVQTAKLLALQSRVEPQMLFDALGRIGELHVGDPAAADGLLADLIALLRAMLPGARAENSTVAREFALVDAWLRVTRTGAEGVAPVRLHVALDARLTGIAPMLVLPLLRTVLALPRAGQHEWALSAATVGDRLLVKLEAQGRDAGGGEAAGLLASANVSSLHDRIDLLFGRFAHLTVSARPPAMTLNLPRLPEEDPDDDGPDR